MLVVIVVIAILGTNLLLGFFVANTLGYGPQTLSELLTGIYRAPIGWSQRQMSSGYLKEDIRKEWSAQLTAYCPLPPDEEIQAKNQASNEATDWDTLQRAIHYIQFSPVLLDELRFQWRYHQSDADQDADDWGADPTDDPTPVVDQQPATTGEDVEEASDTDESMEESEDASAEDVVADVAPADDYPTELWDRYRLKETLQQWDSYLESYRPKEVDWWLAWHGHWEKYVAQWKKHYREVAAVALVERLISENPEDLLSEPPVSTGPKSVKETRQKKKPSKDQGKRRQQVWIKTQYGRLLQSLFQSSIDLRRIEQQLILFTESKARDQWETSVLQQTTAQANPRRMFQLNEMLENLEAGEAEPNYAMMVIPDHQSLLELDSGKLIALAAQSTMSRHLRAWVEDDELAGSWVHLRGGALLGLMTSDEATMRQKASWILASTRTSKMRNGEFQLTQNCSVILFALKPEKDWLQQLAEMITRLQRKSFQRRLSCGSATWIWNGRRLSLMAPEEVEGTEAEWELRLQGPPIDDPNAPPTADSSSSGSAGDSGEANASVAEEADDDDDW